jgi:LmbE family N-acetylglucosaminyl deacetylase
MRKFLSSPRSLALALLALALLTGGAAYSVGPPGLGSSALEPASTGGLPLVDRALAKLAQHRRLLVVGAHPDDEDTSALALVARGQGGEAAYLSLSRGEGGQNLIGPELGVELGILRSRELLAARQVDGARQFFTRAYDFGYTRSLEETLEKWPQEALLEDAVRVIRRFRPQVIVSVFPTDERAGHGQHQAAGVIAHEAFDTAGEASAFPEQTPWAPSSLFRATWWDRDATTVETELGRVDPLTGKSFYQVAMASRSQHRSQDMGRVQPLGPSQGRYAWVAGPGGPESGDLFAGVDTRLEAIAALLPEGAERESATSELAAARELAEAARAELAAGHLAAAAEPLAAILHRLHAAQEAMDRAHGPGATAASELLDEKIAIANAALVAAAGVAVDAWTEEGTVAPHGYLRVEAVAWHGAGASEDAPEVGLMGVAVRGDVPWEVSPALDEEGHAVTPTAGPLEPGVLATWQLDVSAPEDAAPTIPYFLARPLDGDLYDWSAAPSEVRGEPFGPPPLVVRFLLKVGGESVQVDREVVERVGDQAVGEVRRPLRVVPPVGVTVEPDLLVWSTAEGAAAGAGSSRPVRVVLHSQVLQGLLGRVRLEVPEGWTASEPASFEIRDPRGEATVVLQVSPPADLPRGHYELRAVAELGDVFEGDAAYPVIDYPHIRATPFPQPATVEVAAADIRLPELEAVGFVAGASDRVPAALAAAGFPIRRLSGRQIAEMSAADLDGYDAVVVGSRAYETDPDLGRANPRLLDYARRGGLVLVLYQQYAFVAGGYAPYPLEIARPHDRVTDEGAPATLLVPGHPAFTTPNRIGPEDWEGWVQERGLYFAHTWDEAYTPLLSFPASRGFEPGELTGSLLVAKVGEGTWVYTGLAFFRELPAGVTGAYRLFANLLAL